MAKLLELSYQDNKNIVKDLLKLEKTLSKKIVNKDKSNNLTHSDKLVLINYFKKIILENATLSTGLINKLQDIIKVLSKRRLKTIKKSKSKSKSISGKNKNLSSSYKISKEIEKNLKNLRSVPNSKTYKKKTKKQDLKESFNDIDLIDPKKIKEEFSDLKSTKKYLDFNSEVFAKGKIIRRIKRSKPTKKYKK